jgi:hypothetical protein
MNTGKNFATSFMQPKFTGRVDKINLLKKRLKLSSEQLAALVEPPMDPRELDLILGSTDTIYLDEKAIKSIEKALSKALNEP